MNPPLVDAGPGVGCALLRVDSEMGLEMFDGWRLCWVSEFLLESWEILLPDEVFPNVTDGLQNWSNSWGVLNPDGSGRPLRTCVLLEPKLTSLAPELAAAVPS